MSVKDFLIEQLETFGFPVLLQGSISPSENYPNDFITFQVMNTDTPQSFDNNDAVYTWEFNVNFYSNNPDNVAEIPPEIRRTLKTAGFIPQGKGNDAISDEPGFTGWSMDYYFIEREG